MSDKKVSIIIPAYNEENTIINTLDNITAIMEDSRKNYELIVVNDGSLDRTATVLKDYSRNHYKVKMVGYVKNFGKGHAIKYGVEHAIGEYIVFMDADLDIDPSNILVFLKTLEEKNADAVLGSKRLRKSISKYSQKRKIFSRTYTFILNILFNLPVVDTQTGLKLFKSKLLKEAIGRLTINKYAFDLELILLLDKAGCKIVEKEVAINPSRKKGRIRLKDAIFVIFDTLKIFFRLNFKKNVY